MILVKQQWKQWAYSYNPVFYELSLLWACINCISLLFKMLVLIYIISYAFLLLYGPSVWNKHNVIDLRCWFELTVTWSTMLVVMLNLSAMHIVGHLTSKERLICFAIEIFNFMSRKVGWKCLEKLCVLSGDDGSCFCIVAHINIIEVGKEMCFSKAWVNIISQLCQQQMNWQQYNWFTEKKIQ